MYKLLTRWGLPLILALFIFGFIRPTLAQIAGRNADSGNRLVNAEAGSQAVNGYQQAYYVAGERKVFVTDENQNSTDVVIDGEYMAWATAINGAGQIFLYHIPTQTLTQLTSSSTNLHPRVSSGKVVWEGWTDESWQIFLFDGIRIQQITRGDTSMSPDIAGGSVVFARKDASGQWRAEQYDIASGKTQEVGQGARAKHPYFQDGAVRFQDEVYTPPVVSSTPTPTPSLSPTPTPTPLVSPDTSPTPSPVSPSSSPDPDVSPTPSPEPSQPPVVTEEEVAQELEASPTPLVSPSVSPTPTPTSSPTPSPTPEVLPSPSPETSPVPSSEA